MVQVTELGYIGIEVKRPDEWKTFATEILGMELADDGERDRCYLRMDYWHHRIAVHEGVSDDMTYLGFRVAGPDEFRAMERQLAEAQIECRVGSDEEAEERHVLEIMKLNDPGGNPIEIFHGPEIQFSKPFHPGRRMHGRFKTGTGGLGHCIVRQNDPEAARRFYQALGMRGGVEYKIRAGKRTITPVFMHCNERDHTVAFGIGEMGRRINHIMVEVDNFDDVGLTYDLVRKHKVPVMITPGKHSNDHMYSFYLGNPSGWMFEYGYGGRDATHQSEYYVEDIYGHRPEAGGFGSE
ncbi:MAG TPA: VOC family protein [Candidatus Binataceae bacterium]|jgi:2,3-dihydroxybiphenyl 1,2-dioxygenase|nr:VOC family protein [Candidatus Binataceae bacterium]